MAEIEDALEDNEYDFFKECANNGITTFEGAFIETDSDIFLYGGPVEIVKYCSVNNIKSIFLETSYKDSPEAPDIDKLKQKLTNFFKNRLNVFPFNMLPQMITEDFYNPVLEDVLSKLEVDYREVFGENEITNLSDNVNYDSNNEDEDDGEIETIEAWVLNNGCRIHTTVFDSADFEDESDEGNAPFPTEIEFLNKYAHLIRENLVLREKEAKIESARLVKESRERVYAEITTVVKDNSQIVSLNTQKSRNDYADRLCVAFQEKGIEWLTKKEVRQIVEREYFHLT